MDELEQPLRETPLTETDRRRVRYPDQTVGQSVGEEIHRLFDEFNNTLKEALVPDQTTVQRPRVVRQTDDLKPHRAYRYTWARLLP
jgi:hypothetical protein